MQQIAKKQAGFLSSFCLFPRPVIGERARVRAKPPPSLGLVARHVGPADLLGVG
jgi:hypothetical protein